MEQKAQALLERARYGHLSTTDENGYPYTIGVNILFLDGSFYFHCATAGEKLENIKRDPKVCINVDEMFEIKSEGVIEPCKVGVRYESVVARGRAYIVEDEGRRMELLNEIVRKFTPQLADVPIPPEAAKRTSLVEIVVDSFAYKEHG